MATITKRDLVVSISHTSGLTQQQVLDVLQRFLDMVTNHLSEGNKVTLWKFGTFHVKRPKPKPPRNPSCPESEVVIFGRTIVEFNSAFSLSSPPIDVSDAGPGIENEPQLG